MAGCSLSAIVLGTLGVAGYAQEAGPAKAHGIDYNWEVRPILSDNCYRCHGPDAKARQAGLRLDQKTAPTRCKPSSTGKPNESELMKADHLQGSQAYRSAAAAGS